jgi:hypothetical protein
VTGGTYGVRAQTMRRRAREDERARHVIGFKFLHAGRIEALK